MRDVPFRFGLERVRELRAHDEDRAKEAFAASLQQRLRGAAQLAAADARLRDALDAGTPSGGLSLTGADLLAHQSWVERLERTRSDAQLALHHFDVDLATSRASLTEASRRREALERLKQRQGAEHRATAARREAAALDEIALRGHGRRAGV
ncbi:MAG TPA: flagellar export protein FliJ [Baekduia sp.]|nr:flagellar export protein FliJ [Baekduia sp.]